MPSYIYIVTCAPISGTPTFQFSNPGDLTQITQSAQELARQENGDNVNLADKIQIIQLNMTEARYKQWRKDELIGTYVCGAHRINKFITFNEQIPIKIKRDTSLVKEKATVLNQGIKSPQCFFNKFTGELAASLGGKVAAFSTKAEILTGDKLEEIAAQHIENLNKSNCL